MDLGGSLSFKESNIFHWIIFSVVFKFMARETYIYLFVTKL